MACLFSLPKIVLVDIVTEWIDLKDVGKFDISCRTNKTEVNNYSLLLSSASFLLFKQSQDSPLSIAQLQWICLRKLKICKLELKKNILKIGRGQRKPLDFCHLDLISLVHIILEDISASLLPEQELTRLINSCPKVLKLEFTNVDSFTDNMILNLNGDVLSQITHFIAKTTKPVKSRRDYSHITVSDKTYVHLTKYCRSLEVLEGNLFFQPNNNFIRQTHFIDLITVNCNLKHLSNLMFVHINSTMFPLLSQFCPLIETLEASMLTESVDIQIVSDFIQTSGHLTRFQINMNPGNVTYEVKNSENNHNKNTIINNIITHKYVTVKDTYLRADHLSLFFANINNLHSIQIIGCHHIADMVIDSLTTHNHKTLTELTLPSVFNFQLSTLSFNTLKNMLNQCRLLTHLTLNGTLYGLSTDEIKSLFTAENRVLPLKKLVLERATTLTAPVLIHVLTKCSNIDECHVQNCYMVDGLLMDTFVQNIDRNFVLFFNHDTQFYRKLDGVYSCDEASGFRHQQQQSQENKIIIEIE